MDLIKTSGTKHCFVFLYITGLTVVDCDTGITLGNSAFESRGVGVTVGTGPNCDGGPSWLFTEGAENPLFSNCDLITLGEIREFSVVTGITFEVSVFSGVSTGAPPLGIGLKFATKRD